MATYTEHYNLIKPALNDKVNINNLNDNADIIDTALNNKVDTDETQNITTSANKCMLSDGVTTVEEKIGNLLNGAVFEPFQAPDTSPFSEGGSGYVLKVKYNNTVIGYMAIRPKGYASPAGRKVAIDLYDASWNGIWEIHRDYPV